MSEMFEVEKVDTKDEVINYAYEFLIGDNKTLFITEYETSLILANKLEDLDDIEVIDRTDCDVESDSIVYIKNLGDDVFIIDNVFTEDGNIRIIENDYILIQDKLLLDDIIDEFIYAEEELEVIGYEEDTNDDIEHCTCCECCHCNNKEENIQLPYDSLDEAQQRYIDEITEETEYSVDVLAEVFIKGYRDGVEGCALSIKDAIDKAMDED